MLCAGTRTAVQLKVQAELKLDLTVVPSASGVFLPGVPSELLDMHVCLPSISVFAIIVAAAAQ